MKHNSNGIKGFSLVELIFFIAITAIFASIAIPNFVSYLPKYNLGAGARELLSAMQLARMIAIKSNLNVTLSFDESSNSLTIKDEDGAMREIKLLPSGIKLYPAPSSTSVQFNNRGIPDNSVDASVTNKLSKTKTVSLLATGHARIQ